MTTLFAVIRLVHFIAGSVVSMPVSFHGTEKEAHAAKDLEVEGLRTRIKSANKDLLQRIGIVAINFEVGGFQTAKEELIQVPRLIVPPS